MLVIQFIAGNKQIKKLNKNIYNQWKFAQIIQVNVINCNCRFQVYIKDYYINLSCIIPFL